MNVINKIKECIIKGKMDDIQNLINQAKEEHFTAKDILYDGLIKGMQKIGKDWEKGEVFVPEVLYAARALNHALNLIDHELKTSNVQYLGTVVIGTVKGDLHDIGKNLVALMLKGAGFKVIDIGVDCGAEKFIEAAIKSNANIIAMSSLLTSTMLYMKTIMEELKDHNIRHQVKVICGGAPVTESFVEEIGGDFYAQDAIKAVEVLKNVKIT